MDPVLHQERLDGKQQRQHLVAKTDLVDGAMVFHKGKTLAVKEGRLLAWSFTGYQTATGLVDELPAHVTCLTPPATNKALANGYQPIWHESAIE